MAGRRSAQLLLRGRVVGFATLVPLIVRLPLPCQEAILEPRRARPPDPARAAWLAEHVDGLLAAGRPVVRPGCLTRGLTHYFFLRRAGVDVHLAYGVGEVNGRTEGHCWLVRDGEPWLERADPREHFVETYAIPRAAAHARA